ncbi:RNA polymerase II-associated protein RBA50 [Fulvia fulva]|uniref:RNA polymerase II-associated protein RBA50 n=1 Tax=Passalora fulva TaxID=5499 RepID=A0A9Q8PJ11_PASFU|nr:RNA polymerase II-associated protein RBA50 [Fulvia fulva]KAK4611549.1 RNA polymerase II-associated protein RBA50 [Fulvia fulva]KAK4612603.1 RNA polymerase II-associated protein RBA50 [Fulvia fulva]UJO23300.1 RNA polymerase II-associated protein RBA50 [Fulvia fulva]WPV21030.1 RNA polymerase II-associated protein RBA50 [Fulvia fulva]WPV35780.1 RNA polymerase II-associated protein RBA50 [Fulvia fulva]
MIRGERFELDLGSDDEHDAAQHSATLPGAFVGDVLERQPAAPKPPSLPSLKSKSGFPEHKKRNVESRFKQRKATKSVDQTTVVSGQPAVEASSAAFAPAQISGSHASGKAKSWEEEEKERIDQENRQKMAEMSADEIEEERRELLSSLSPELVQKLLQRSKIQSAQNALLRSNVESGSEEVDLSIVTGPSESVSTAPIKDDKGSGPEPDSSHRQQTSTSNPKPDAKPAKTARFEEEPEAEAEGDHPSNDHNQHDHATTSSLPHDTVHFPRPPQPPSLDPSSDTFLSDLHQKYFPSLPSDPSKLEWMQTSSTSGDHGSYDPSATAFSAKDIRFDFHGRLIPPREAASIPVTQGLHHHGEAPDSAGYTIAELAHLARSSYAAQRSIAFQTLGRVLYRLSKGEFGDSPGAEAEVAGVEILQGQQDAFSELARGLWHEVERLQVIPILISESEGTGVDGGRHVSAKAYATEAVWLWRKGGGKRMKAA